MVGEAPRMEAPMAWKVIHKRKFRGKRKWRSLHLAALIYAVRCGTQVWRDHKRRTAYAWKLVTCRRCLRVRR